MREILFRGMDIHSNWHIGLLAHVGNAWYISNQAGIATAYEVIPKTVGQYTGLTDKNGKKIFEGDIVKYYTDCPLKEYSIDIGRIFWYQATQRYLRTSSIFPNDCPELFESNEYEVIGNIYDNPELLKNT